MFLTLLPLRLIWFQFFLLLIAIATEAFVLRERLNFGRKKTIFYAASINLISTFLGWLLFFLLVPTLSVTFKTQLIGYIFFDKIFFDDEISSIYAHIWLTIAAIAIFFISLTIKMRSFQLLQMWLNPPKPKDDVVRERFLLGAKIRSPVWLERAKIIVNILIFGRTAMQKKTLIQPNLDSSSISISRRQALAILWAHAGSNILILGILLLRKFGLD